MEAWLPEIPDWPVLLVFGAMVSLGQVAAHWLQKIKVPPLVTYMAVGLLTGPSVLNLLTDGLLENLHFLTEATLGFVAFKIGLELDLATLKTKGKGMILTIFTEAFMAIALVVALVYFTTGSLPLALFFGALAPASAPAGTVAVIDQYQAKGPLTQALYAVVGFDDALGVVIFGILLALGQSLMGEAGEASIWATMLKPFREIGFSILAGAVLAGIFVGVARLIRHKLTLTFGFILLGVGLSQLLHLSEILIGMVMGLVIGNSPKQQSLRAVEEEDMGILLPLFYSLFFSVAGANLHLQALDQVGMLGVVYIAGRSLGLGSGAYLGASLGKLHPNVRRYLGFGIQSQAGVAIGLALVLKQSLSGFGPVVSPEEGLTLGDQLGKQVFTTITVTTFFFELVGPFLARYGLEKAGETQE